MIRHRIPDDKFAIYLAEYEALAMEMRTPYAIGRWDLEVVSPGGAVVDRQSFYSQSWLRNYVNMLCNFVLSVRLNDSLVEWGDSFLNIRERDDTITNNSTVSYLSTLVSVGDDVSGIVLGSGTTEETLDDYDLDVPINHGRAGGELYHYAGEGDTAWEIWSWDSLNKKFANTLWRFFLNDGGVDVTVKEAGLASNVSTIQALLVRDVLSSEVVVPDLHILRAKYTIQSTVFPG